jgi:hypothetical protein
MKLCSQCEFIYEDDQERCDMDGAQLVYEPTLEHVFPNNALQARTELEGRGPARLVIPLSRLPQPETSSAPANVVATRSRLPLQIAAVATLAALSFIAFYATPRPFQTNPQTAKSTIETQKRKLETSHPSPIVSDVATTSEKPSIRNAKPETSLPSDRFETAESKPTAPIPALPGLKPLPRLKPLPTLKPIPRLADRSRSVTAGRKTMVVNTSASTKRESRFGSFLKKTGRVLTKPFKS